jgi:hypothetical protein
MKKMNKIYFFVLLNLLKNIMNMITRLEKLRIAYFFEFSLNFNIQDQFVINTFISHLFNF